MVSSQSRPTRSIERVFLVGTFSKGSAARARQAERSLNELERLAETAGGRAAGRLLQGLDSPSPGTYIGRGKAEELSRLAQDKAFDTLVFDDELKPAQQKNLSELIPAKVLDRTRLILDIFARRARTREGILQVELAQLSYLLPRMTERYGRFEQQVGGIGTRGPGERKLEVEARHIRDRMAHLRRAIDSVRLHRAVARERRQAVPLPTVAIVGYTNAGKSTLLNALVDQAGRKAEPIYADDKLFATLDPTTRRLRLPSGRWALFTDTVGFIDKLPHHLIAAFRSTLEETVAADLLVHVADASDPEAPRHFRTVLDTLRSLGLSEEALRERSILALNKMDLGAASSPSEEWPATETVRLSALQGKGTAELLEKVEEKLAASMTAVEVTIPYAQSRVIDSFYRLGQVEQVEPLKHGLRLRARMEPSHWQKIQNLLGLARPSQKKKD